MKRCSRKTSKSGFTLIEITIAMTIAVIIIANVVMVQNASNRAYESGVFGSALEDSADTAMDRIALAIMSTSSEDLDEVLGAPASVSRIDYEVIVDVVGGEPGPGTPERIEFLIDDGVVRWSRDPGMPTELSTVWTKWVPELLEGELFNNKDDNGNGIADEEGLAFDKEFEQLRVQMTLSRTDKNHQQYVRTRSRRATCRN